jgi:hypothetical protein
METKTKDELYLEAKNNIEKYVNNDIKISFSEFSKYMECGHRHLIENHLKLVEQPPSIHLIFGNSIHAAIEAGIQKKYDVDQRISFFSETFIKEMMDKMFNTPDYSQANSFLEQGVHILRTLQIEKIFEHYDLVGVEEPLYELLFKNYFFKGFVDLILQHKTSKRYLILDWKTSGEAWDVSKKKKNEIFMAQMRFYKYFYARKFNLSIDDIDCKYIVLNRLKSKFYPELGFGQIQTVEIFSSHEHIKHSIEMMSDVVKEIHINSHFPKAKLTGKIDSCRFCPFKKDGVMCNSDPYQYKEMLYTHKTKNLFAANN